jgi:hypothetical protein
MSHALHPILQVMIALLTLAMLTWPSFVANGADFDGDDSYRHRIP